MWALHLGGLRNHNICELTGAAPTPSPTVSSSITLETQPSWTILSSSSCRMSCWTRSPTFHTSMAFWGQNDGVTGGTSEQKDLEVEGNVDSGCKGGWWPSNTWQEDPCVLGEHWVDPAVVFTKFEDQDVKQYSELWVHLDQQLFIWLWIKASQSEYFFDFCSFKNVRLTSLLSCHDVMLRISEPSL